MKYFNSILIVIVLAFTVSCAEKMIFKTEGKQLNLEGKKKMVASKGICSTDFSTFFKKFATDSVFQKNSVQFPLKYTYYSDVTSDEPTEEYLNEVTYLFIDFSVDKEASNLEYDKLTVEKVEAENTIVYKRIGMDNGIRETYKFRKEKDCWFLAEILDEST